MTKLTKDEEIKILKEENAELKKDVLLINYMIYLFNKAICNTQIKPII